MALKSFAITTPMKGIRQDFPAIFLRDAYLPDDMDNIKNIIWRYGEIHRVRMREKEFTQALPDRVLHYDQYWQKDLDWWLMACTRRDIAYRDTTNDRWNYVTPQYATGVIRVENGSTEIYGGLNIDDCDDDGVAWVDGSGGDVTPARETSDKKENSACVKLTVAATAGVELLAYHDLAAPVDLSGYDAIGFWFKSSVALDAGDLKFQMDDTAGCGSPVEDIAFPAVTADTWTWIELDMDDPSNCSAIAALGIYQAVDKGAMTLYIDQIVAGDWEGQLNDEDFITIGTTYSTDDTWYEIDSVTDTHITLKTAYAGSTAYQQAYLARQTYGGTNTDFWESITYNDKWISTNNGVGYLQVWEGTGQASDLAGSPPKGKHITIFENYIILGNLVVSGTEEPYSYAWCAVGDETNWSTGDSGSAEIDDYYHVNGFAELHGFLIILTERTIEKVWNIGGDLVFNRERITADVGAWAPKSIIEISGAIYFYAADNTFRCFTGSTWEAISDPIDKFVKNLHPDYEIYMQATYVESYDLILWAVPDVTSTGRNNNVLIYDLSASTSNDRWSRKVMEVCAFGYYEVETSFTWDTLPYATWDEWAWDKWDTREGLEGAPHELCADYSGYTHRMFASEEDNDAEYTGSFVIATDFSKDKKSFLLKKRVSWFQVIFRNEGAGTVSLYVKRDFETSWQSIGTVSLDGNEDILILDVNYDILAKSVQFKFEATNTFRFLGMIFPEIDEIGVR